MSSLLRAESVTEAPAPAPTPPNGAPDRPRRRLKRALIGLNIVLALGVLLLGSGLAYAYLQDKRIHKIAIATADRAGEAALVTVPKGDPFNVLVVGSDSRAFAKNAHDKAEFGTGAAVDGQRSDTMMVIRVDPKHDKASVLSIPRDMYVDLEGGGKGRLNEAFASIKDQRKPDPDRLIRTIYKNFGISINHYVEVDFYGFRDAVNAIGGVKVYFAYPSRDAYSRLNIATAGCVQLDGENALSYVRSRHYEYQVNGRWKADPTSDFGRIKRQQDFIRRLVRKAVADGLTNPIKAHKLIEAGINNVTVDEGLGLTDMKNLASQLRNLNEAGMVFLSIPGTPIMVGADSVLRLDKDGANEALVAFGAAPLTTTTSGQRTTTKPAPTPQAKVETGIPSGTTVRIYNTTGKAGLASSTAESLSGMGVNTASAGNRPLVPTTQIRFPAGADAAAQALQRLVGGGATLQADTAVRKGEIQLLLGTSFSGIQAPAAPTATTVAPAPPPSVAPPTTQPALGSDPSKIC